MSSRSPAPQPSPPPHRTNWAAVSAVAACGGVFVAFLTYAIPHQPSPPTPTPYTTTVPLPPATSPVSPQQGAPDSLGVPITNVPAAGPPTACQPVNAAITEYDQTVGPSWYSKADAASRARDQIEMAMSQSGGGANPDVESLLTDFQGLYGYAEAQATSSYNTVAAQTNTDIQAFRSNCNPG